MTSIFDLSDLTGRTALITGATGSLGKIFAQTLNELGADLILIDRPGSDFESVTSTLVRRDGINVENYYCDLEIQINRSNLISKIMNLKKKLNILVNNAAFVGASDLPGWSAPFVEQSTETWRRALELNLTAVFDLCQGLYPLLKESTGANIVNIASIYGMHGPDWGLYRDTNLGNSSAYAASKGGLVQLTRWLATTIAPQVRVNAIAPGGVFRHQPEVFVKRYERKVPLGRMASEEDFRGAIAYLASDLSKYVTGQILSVDGGWGTW
jgi:NAD(P)-dependent dehydrogenase (short-subunit alcohol dehydrogenase family)